MADRRARPMLMILLPGGGIDMKYYPEKDLLHGCPKFEIIRRDLGMEPDVTLEHLLLRFQGKTAHMFMDEDGLMKRLPVNDRASTTAGRMIVGPVGIWTGEMR